MANLSFNQSCLITGLTFLIDFTTFCTLDRTVNVTVI